MDSNVGSSTPASSGRGGPLADITNLSATELRRKRDRERYASLSAEQKEARNKKIRENRKRKKENAQGLNQINQSATRDVAGNEHIQSIITPRRLAFSETGPLGDITKSSGDSLRIGSQRETYDSLKLEQSGSYGTRQPMITPTRLPFTMNNIVFDDDNMDNTEVPSSSIIQETTQNNLAMHFVRDKSGTTT